MSIQEIYDAMTPYERQQFANQNIEVIKEILFDDNSIDLSGCSKEEIIEELKDRELTDTVNGMLYAGVREAAISSWLEKQLID